MRKDPEVLRTYDIEEGAGFELKIPEDLAYTDGHFPGNPVVPGVVLVDWAIQRAMESFDGTDELEEVERLKFKKILQPGNTCRLELSWSTENRRLSFEYAGEEEEEEDIYASGHLIFSSR